MHLLKRRVLKHGVRKVQPEHVPDEAEAAPHSADLASEHVVRRDIQHHAVLAILSLYSYRTHVAPHMFYKATKSIRTGERQETFSEAKFVD